MGRGRHQPQRHFAVEMKWDLQRLERDSALHGRAPTEDSAAGRVRGPGRWLPRQWASVLMGACAFAIVVVALALYIAPRIGSDGVPAGASQQITSGHGLKVEAVVSPDGSMVAYTSDDSGNKDMWISDTRGGPPRRFTTSPARDCCASWFPDGSAIAFVSDRGGQPGIWKAPRLDGDAAVQLIQQEDQVGGRVSRQTSSSLVRCWKKSGHRWSPAPVRPPSGAHIRRPAASYSVLG
jgi:hypothetical protein